MQLDTLTTWSNCVDINNRDFKNHEAHMGKLAQLHWNLKDCKEYIFIKMVYLLFGDEYTLYRIGIPDMIKIITHDIYNYNELWNAVIYFSYIDSDLTNTIVTLYTRISGDVLTLTIKSISQEIIKYQLMNDSSFVQELGMKPCSKLTISDLHQYIKDNDWCQKYDSKVHKILPVLSKCTSTILNTGF